MLERYLHERATRPGRALFPNPRETHCPPMPFNTEGYRLRVLDPDPDAADVVARIFTEYLDGCGDRGIANGLNRDGIPCPSARRPDQDSHRPGDGWQGSTVRAIVDNPRYTGYAFFGRWVRTETLLDPDDVAAGHVIRFRRAASDRMVRSRRPAHPAIVSAETFITQATLARDATRARWEGAETRLRRLRAAVEAGVDPTALVESINEAQAQRVAARVELDAAVTTERGVLTDAEVYAMIDSLGDIGEALNSANPDGCVRSTNSFGWS